MKRLLGCAIALLLLTGCAAPAAHTPPEYDSVVIAMLDTGISTTAIDSSHLLPGYNYVTSSTDTEDRINHGTATASIIVGCESANVTGLAPDVLLIPLVVTDKVDGKVTGISPQMLAQAIRDAVDVYGADIINVSLGIKKDASELKEAVTYAENKGVLVVSAVGNEGENGDCYYPAAYDTVLGVGSHDKHNAVSDFSQQNGTADLLAPGESIWMASRSGATYGAKGTSYAAAYVSAAAALLLKEYPALIPQQLRQTLYDATTDIGAPGWDSASGWGTLNTAALTG